jgi:hypothetical protein
MIGPSTSVAMYAPRNGKLPGVREDVEHWSCPVPDVWQSLLRRRPRRGCAARPPGGAVAAERGPVTNAGAVTG